MIKTLCFKTAFLIVFSFYSVFTFAQPETLVTSNNFIQRLLKLNNILYYTTGSGVFYIDINDPNFSPQQLISLNPADMEYKDGFLYVSDFGNNKIIKIDLSQATTNPVDVVNTPNGATDLLFIGDDLYYSSAITNNVFKYNINTTNASIENVVSTPNFPNGLEHKNGVLYITVPTLDTIYNLDLNTPNAILNVVLENESAMDSPLQLELYNNHLYVANWFSNNILKIDTDATPINPETVLTLDGVSDLEIDQNMIYYCNLTHIYRDNLTALSVDDFSKNTITLYPNPTQNEIQISSLKTKKTYIIFNILGIQVKKGILYPNEKINVSTLNTGVFFIKIGTEPTPLKFVKL